jgi:valyl-tRNA synthetase
MLDSHFDHSEAERRLYAEWEASGAFKPSSDPAAEPYCIMIPPPNVTGSLHMGHAFTFTLQDILIRFQRMRGKAVLWQPGTDHAGIATQMVVERQMAASGANITRADMGRDAFIAKVWEWKAESGGTITRQLKRLGASCDWSRERFTLDDGLSAAVRKVFVALHKEGLIYRDKRLVNWDPHFETAISDLEVVRKDTKGTLWKIAYPLEDGSGEIVVATTRPETLFGDVCVAVNPKDKRYTHLIGKKVRLPLADRLIPIVADDHSDPEKGTGAVKITPAHDFDDFQVGKRQGLTPLNILDPKGALNENVPARFVGIDRFEARKLVLAELETLELRRGEDTATIAQPYGDRSGVVIEPYLTDQWYVDVKGMAQRSMEAVRSGETRIIPSNWEKVFFQWMENIEPWCVSRQLWWGHRIPAWHDADGNWFVGETEAEAKVAAKTKLGKDVALTQDEDVLDTWFSSGLWPFSTLGWPDQTPELKRFYPTSVLVTGFDIIFFWVARMMMMGTHFMDAVPFKTVYIHALVRDESGAKMSKSKGNVIDPLEILDDLGADALRFTLAAMAAQGRDIKLSRQRVEGYRSFGTKLWNASRFCQMNECVVWDAYDPAAAKQTINRWIIGETAKAVAALTRDLDAFRFDQAANGLYRFVWNVFCDWYVELIKPMLNGDDEAAKAETRRTAAWVLDQILILLHPFMPFLTEELWAKLAEFGPKRTSALITTRWPDLAESLVDEAATAEIDWVIRLVSETRSARSELDVPAGAKIPLLLIGADSATKVRLERYQDLIDRLARLEYSTSADVAPDGSVIFVVDEATVALPLKGIVDFDAERERLSKEVVRCKAEIAKIDAKLSNESFVARAPEEVVDEQRERRAEYQAMVDKYSAAVARLAAAA